MKKRWLLIALTLAACTAQPERLALAPVASSLQLQPQVGSVMVRAVSLPRYAAAEEIPLQTPAGLITADSGILWADDPQRAVTLAVTTTLATILGVDAGPEPWPFVGLPDVTVDIRVAQMLAGSDGRFALTGQYFIGGDGIDFRDKAQAFAITTALADPSVGAIAAAQSAAVLLLSEQIARDLAR